MGDSMGHLRFYFGELLDEAQAMSELGGEFLDASGENALRRLISRLDDLAARPENAVSELEINDLRTRPSRDYEQGSREGARSIYALVTGKWTLRSIGQPNTRRRQVEFAGKASAMVTLWEDSQLYIEDCCKREAMWRIEVASHDSPGCYFHMQVLGDREKRPFPKDISIPRLPSLFVTPMAAVEFVLCELFQDRWAEAANKSTHHRNRWRRIQEERLRRLLKWQTKQVTGSQHSPWMKLKEAKPDRDIFLDET